MKKLERTLSLPGAIAVSIGGMLSGIFVLPGLAVGITGSSVWLAFLVAALCILPAVLSKSELVDEIGFESSFKLSILTLTNTVNSQMYGLENLNFGNLLTSSKISLIIFMIIGKIELVSIFLIFKKILFKD